MSIERTTEHIAGIHPGEMLREEFMVPLQLSSNALAMALRVPATRILEIAHERRGVSADNALRPARYSVTPAQFWMNMQRNYDLAVAKEAAGTALAQIECRSA
jgi:addiction module HigA family antidote